VDRPIALFETMIGLDPEIRSARFGSTHKLTAFLHSPFADWLRARG
jgi:hypothetical protein